MKILAPTVRYMRDLKKLHKRGWGVAPLGMIQECLRLNKPLPPSARPHKLSGEWEGFWECHVASDWLLIYELTESAVLLARTGTHADLFE